MAYIRAAQQLITAKTFAITDARARGDEGEVPRRVRELLVGAWEWWPTSSPACRDLAVSAGGPVEIHTLTLCSPYAHDHPIGWLADRNA